MHRFVNMSHGGGAEFWHISEVTSYFYWDHSKLPLSPLPLLAVYKTPQPSLLDLSQHSIYATRIVYFFQIRTLALLYFGTRNQTFIETVT